MADDREMVIRFLNMLRGSLDEKNRRLLEELRLKRLIALGVPGRGENEPATPQVEDERTARGAVAPASGIVAGRARSVA